MLDGIVSEQRAAGISSAVHHTVGAESEVPDVTLRVDSQRFRPFALAQIEAVQIPVIGAGADNQLIAERQDRPSSRIAGQWDRLPFPRQYIDKNDIAD